MFISIVFLFRVHAGKQGQVTNCTIVSGTSKHRVDQYTYGFVSLLFARGVDTAMLGGLHAMLCHAFLVFTARRLAKRGICRRRVSVCLSVSLSLCVCVCVCVCLSHSGIVSKRLNVGSRK